MKYDDVYKIRRKKVGKKKALISEKYAMEAKIIHNTKNLKKQIIEYWEKENTKLIIEEKSKYTIFNVDDVNVILTTNKNVLKDYKNVERKGIVKNITDEYEKEILLKTEEENDIKLNPNLYYTIFKG